MYFFGYGGDIVNFFGRYRRQLRSREDIQKTAGLSPADARRVRQLYPSKSCVFHTRTALAARIASHLK